MESFRGSRISLVLVVVVVVVVVVVIHHLLMLTIVSRDDSLYILVPHHARWTRQLGHSHSRGLTFLPHRYLLFGHHLPLDKIIIVNGKQTIESSNVLSSQDRLPSPY